MGSIKLTISVNCLEDVLVDFDAIRVKKGDSEAGPFAAITADVAAAATLLAPLDENYDVVGKTLQIIVDSNPQVDITFTGAAVLPAADVVSQINTALGASIAAIEGDAFRLTSTIVGSESIIEIVGGTALADFGFTAGDRDVGEESHVFLQPEQTVYNFTDNDGSSSDYYVVQYINTSTLLQSNDSDPFQGTPGTVIDAADLSKATVDLVDGMGQALALQHITIYSSQEILKVGNFHVGMNRASFTIVTDNAGHAEVCLVAGLKVKVVFEGTNYIREFTVPDTDFNLLDAMATAPDPFDIEEPKFPFSIRRTL